MDACNYSRYLNLDNNGWWGYMRHSPMGPGFMPYQVPFNLDPEHPFFHEGFLSNLAQAKLVVVDSEKTEHAMKHLGFDSAAPNCAKAFLPVGGKRILFRASKG